MRNKLGSIKIMVIKGCALSSWGHSIRRTKTDLEQGGLEIPAKITFIISNERIIEVMKTETTPLTEEYNDRLV